jgi:ribosomal protein S18 acetylase RimI-like enzyme
MREIYKPRFGKMCTLEMGGADAGGGSVEPKQTAEQIVNPERYKLGEIRGISEAEPTINIDYLKIATWVSDDDVRRHLRTPITKIIKKEDIPIALKDADRYYHNKNRQDKEGNYIDDDPSKIIPMVATNGLDELVASLVIRLKGDPFSRSSDEKVAGIESVVVDPNLKGSHFGTMIMTAAIETLFDNGVYDGKPANAVRLWIFANAQTGNITPKIVFFRAFGFEVTAGNWKGYAEARGMSDDRDGQQYELTREVWEKIKKIDLEKKPEEGGQKFVLPTGAIRKSTLRTPHVSAKNN